MCRGVREYVYTEKSQLVEYNKEEELQFIFDCIDFIKNDLSELNSFLDDFEIQTFIAESFSFAKNFQIFNELSIQKLIYYKLKFGFSLIDKSESQKYLVNFNISEEARVIDFHKYLLKSNGFID